jgi:hypothetical protein
MAEMTDRIRPARGATLACALLALALPGTAIAAPVSVNLRVEGRSSTIFDAPVTTDGHDVTTDSGGTHECDGTNGPTPEPEPGPTATAALDDAARLAGFTWDGTYSTNPSFPDYLINRIAGDSIDPSSEYWSLWIAFDFASEGGCQQRVRQGDDVLWGYSPFADDRALRLTGPSTAVTGQPVRVRVNSGASPGGDAGAQVGGATTGADGTATLSFPDAGVYRLKAEKENAVRSNSLILCVDPPGADACTSTDKVAPSAQVLVPRFASERSRSRTFVVAWQGSDGTAGSGVSGYRFDARDLRSRTFKTLVGRTAAVGRSFRGKAGHSYEFRVAAFDRANNRGGFATRKVTVPLDDSALRVSRGWKRSRSSQAWGGKLLRAQRRGAVARMSFSGRRVGLIGRVLPRGGLVRVTIDGRSIVLGVRGKAKQRALLYLSSARRSGRHSLRLEALGGGPVDIDAVAPVR